MQKMRITGTIRIWLLAVGLFCFVITETMRSLYRPWVYSHGYADFHFADAVGSSGGAITAVLVVPALLCRKKGPAVLPVAIGIGIAQLVYEFVQPLAKTGVFDWYDVTAAGAGGGAGVLIVSWLLRRHSRDGASQPGSETTCFENRAWEEKP